jgi:hypothetical protein
VKARFLSIASRELHEAIAHYELVDSRLGDRFRGEVKGAVDRIKANQAAWTPFEKMHQIGCSG